MSGNTHLAVGVATALAVTKPATISELILSAAVGGVGALISDIDTETSGAHKKANRIIMLTMIGIFGIWGIDYHFQTNIFEQIIKNSGYGRIVTGTLAFIVICAFGKEQPHRSFMHSLLAGLLLCLSIHLIWEKAVIYFAIGFLSHLAIDSLNKKKIRLFYPFKGGIAFGLCQAYGLVNYIFFMVASAVIVMEVRLSVMRILAQI